jgi:hypothetical protein
MSETSRCSMWARLVVSHAMIGKDSLCISSPRRGFPQFAEMWQVKKDLGRSLAALFPFLACNFPLHRCSAFGKPYCYLFATHI